MITYQQERYADVIDEMKPLLERHYEEVAAYKDRIKFNPDYAGYEAMDALGILDIFTARDTDANNALVGYCVSFVNAHPHYSDHVYAVNDVVYVDPDYRHGEVAPEMISRLEKRLEEMGVSVMTFHMKTYKPFRTLMESLGFDEIESMYSKYIKEQ